ncbi:unnamed protein product [Adineta ricciae]|uniref:Erythromycin esterase n=1 Tax=Adineta ricciae TaxID=249248 RepID=A0A813WPY6_ADIRI|nr:unnamed protein product [Adineta ricciae]
MTKPDPKVVQLIEENAQCLRANERKDYDSILSAIGDGQIVLIGEASHGTHDFYSHRAEITKRLIQEKGFTIIACEADWPPAYRVNQWIKSTSTSTIKDAEDSLRDFTRFPPWLWRNTVIVDFLTWLRQYNENINDRKAKIGFFGLDLYSLQSSREEVLKYLGNHAPDLLRLARKNYRCFDRYTDEHEYGVCARANITTSCRKEAIKVLTKMLERHAEIVANEKSTETELEESFYAMENAKIVREAEKYYRHMFDGGQAAWNIRDTHMYDCLKDLLEHHGPGTKAIIWAHNSHIGDARETERSRSGKLNIGQLVRERFGIEKTYNIAFTTYTGTVTASDNWDIDPDFKRVRLALNESFEFLFHQALVKSPLLSQHGQYFLLFRSNNPSIEISKELYQELRKQRLERAIGVIYRPRTERQSHYLDASISAQFDCVIHIEITRALRPLEIHPTWAGAEKDHIPDTFPMNV